jgi:nucleoside-triphosphatase THEP1
MTQAPLLAAVRYTGGAEYDLLLARVAAQAAACGVRLAGVVQVNEQYDALCACDMTLRDLSSGVEVGISQRLGRHARGCRLDPSSLEYAVGMVEAGLRAGAEALVLNKFGKMEASGRGFRPLIAEALEAGVPVLVGVNELNLAAWQEFAGEEAELLPADDAALLAWLLAASAPLRKTA